ncbi:hypothetical protein [Streptacidiphilus sp. MAP5-52]|uniref:hypothetical protein n=1 Tax=Streptacidiphilus sp. MAP5-52 TaxID=3156267 RepID=UPI003512BC04
MTNDIPSALPGSPTAARPVTLRPRAAVYLNLGPDPELQLRLDEDELVERCHAFAAFMSMTVREGDTVVERSPLPAHQRSGWQRVAALLDQGAVQHLITWELVMLGCDRPSAQEVAEELRVREADPVHIHEVADVEHQLPVRDPGSALRSAKWRPLGAAQPSAC